MFFDHIFWLKATAISQKMDPTPTSSDHSTLRQRIARRCRSTILNQQS
jgi:hypothetical protein